MIRADRVIAVSAATSREVQKIMGVPPGRIRMVYNGLDTDFFHPETGVSRQESRLLFVGNTDDTKKGIFYLLQALTRLPPQTTLTIVDHGSPWKTYAPQLIKELGLASRVRFTGKVSQEDLRELYLSSTVAVLPSLYEGFGLPTPIRRFANAIAN